MAKELYYTVEGPRGRAEIFELVSEATAGTDQAHTWGPQYQVQFGEKTETYPSEGEAITAAQEMVGAETVY